MVDALSNALSGMQSAATRAGSSANNIANMGNIGAKTRDKGPSAYTPVDAVSTAQVSGGVSTTLIPRDPATVTSYAPDHPYADDAGLVDVPNVSLDQEIINLKMAEIAYKASAKVAKIAGDMQDELIRAFDEKV